MKQTRSIVGKLITSGLVIAALVMAGNLSADSTKQGSARVLRVQGAARYSTGNNIWLPLEAGMVLRPGALIQTARNSQLDLILSDSDAAGGRPTFGGGAGGASKIVYRPGANANTGQDAVRMRENTLLAIDKLLITKTGADVVKETELDLRSGRILGSVKKLTGASKYEVKIPNGVAGIRGTIYEISSTGVLSVISGSVVLGIVDKDGNVTTEVVNAGQQYDPATGKVTDIPNFDPQKAKDEAKAAGLSEDMPPTTYTKDNTTIYVSPTLGAEQPLP